MKKQTKTTKNKTKNLTKNISKKKNEKLLWILLIAAVICILLFLAVRKVDRDRKEDDRGERYDKNNRSRLPKEHRGSNWNENTQNIKAPSAEIRDAKIKSAEIRNNKKIQDKNVIDKAQESGLSDETWNQAPESRLPDKAHTKGIQKIACVLYLVIALGMCALPLLAMGAAGWQGKMEDGSTVSLPKLYTEEDGLHWDYLSEVGKYFNGHFAFRSELVTLDSYIKTTVFGVSPVSDVIAGEDGWLYYTATLDDFWHKDPASDRMLFNIAHNISLMQRYTESLGMEFIFTVAPNKNSLYYRNMPSRMLYRVNPESDMERLSFWLDKEQVHYVDLFALFEGQDEVLYYQRDSHWNQKGAVMVYNALLDACGREHETYEDSQTEIVYDYYGDLNRMLFPSGGKPEQDIRYMDSAEWAYSLGESVEDSLVITESREGSQTLLMYRDSFGNSLLPLMAGEYAQAVFSKIVPYAMTDLAVYWPDVVIVEKVERHLPTFAEVPPLMGAPEVTLEGEQIPVESNTTVDLSKEGSYWMFSGIADAEYLSTGSCIFLEITDADGMRAYEAFCVSYTGDEPNDNGYALYISEISLSGDLVNIKVMTERNGEIIVLKEEEVYLTNG